MHVLCLAGAWCGDCVLQGPILQRVSEASPAVVFLSEDFEECGRYGDRTIAMYRRMAHERLGAACPTGLAVPEDGYVDAVIGDWMDEVERVQLLLRLSPRLRLKHSD